MKRIFNFHRLALLALLVATMRLCADVYTVRVPDYQANPGTVLRVLLALDNAAGLAQVRLQLNYDLQVLTLVNLSPGPLGAQFELSYEVVGGAVTMDFVRATVLAAGSGRLAVAEFLVNAGATTDVYSDLAIARFEIGDATGVRNIAAGQVMQTVNGSARVSVSNHIDNESNGIPDAWELKYNLDLYSPAANRDTDGDTLSDLLEYAFGGHPLIPDEDQVAPVASLREFEGHRYLTATFRRHKETIGLNYVLQESETLSDWESFDLNSRLISAPVDLGNGMESVTVRGGQALDAPDAMPRGFMRIGVELEPRMITNLH